MIHIMRSLLAFYFIIVFLTKKCKTFNLFNLNHKFFIIASNVRTNTYVEQSVSDIDKEQIKHGNVRSM